MAYQIILVDDHIILAKAIQSIIEKDDAFHVTHVLKNGRELIDLLPGLDVKPDLILLDINMPVMNGMEVAKVLQQQYPELKFLTLTMNDEEMSIIKMFNLGAKGYLLKDADPEELMFAMTSILNKGFYYSDFVASVLMKNISGKSESTDTKSPTIILKDRELEFLKHCCSEMTYKEIADVMFLSPKTIDGYREHLFQKLNVKSRVGLVLYSFRKNLFKIG